MHSVKRKLSKNIVSLTIVQIANYVLPIISLPIISRIIGPDGYGTINFFGAIIVYFTILINYGFDLSATRRIAHNPNDVANRNKVFSEVFFAKSLLFLLSIIIFCILLVSIPKFRDERLVAIFSFLTCVATLGTQNWLFQAMQDLQKVALFNLFSKFFNVVFVLLIIKNKEDYVWLPLISSVVMIIVAIISFWWVFKQYNIQLKRVSISECLNLLWHERAIFFSMAVVSLYTVTNTVILGMNQSVREVGYYTASEKLIVIAQSVINMPLSQAFYPFIGQAFAESKSKGLQITQKLIPLLFLFTGSITLFMFIFGPSVLSLLYGDAFSPAIPAFLILALIPLLVSISNVFGVQVMLNLNMDKIFFRITALGALTSVTLNLILVQQIGFIAPAISWLTTEILILISMYYVLRGKGIHTINRKYWKISLIAEQVNPFFKSLLRK